ncbi:dephospho-CoA kinase [Marinobacter salicampi]|uniref:dephospho-CoA kinase n=1 Tax=Marinobacter salicampi TaxID=435907 RepID=UPI00140B44C6|nr:dephospho-CoA kinase [Marinobacter salicampi]
MSDSREAQPAIVGLTGGIGSGKSTVARLFGEVGVHWVDADDVAREVVAPGMPALAQIAGHFGDELISPDGSLDRAALRTLVFNDPAQRQWLESLLHPIIREELVRQLRPEGYSLPYVLLVSPLLLETDQHTMTQRVIVIDVPVEVQIERTMSRDENPRDQVERIIASQLPREERLARADEVVHNDRPRTEVAEEVQALHQRLVALFR